MAMAFSPDYASEDTVDEDLVRHVSLDGIRYVNSKFRRKYGSPVIAVDSVKGSWRKQIFPYYKASRSEARKESNIDWPALLQLVNKIKEEIKEVFPYKVIEVKKAEADDIIGTLARYAVLRQEHCMIVSGDKDFIQLQIDNGYVQQWDKRLDKYVGAEDPKRYLFEHVLCGDRGDGIPNILSPGDCFVNKVRQRPMRKNKIDEFWENKELLREFPRFAENLKLIDLRFTPKEIQTAIIDQYENYQVNDKQKLHQYLIEKRMKKLYQSISDF